MKNKTALLLLGLLLLELVLLPDADAWWGRRRSGGGRGRSGSRRGGWFRRARWSSVGRTAGKLARGVLQGGELALQLAHLIKGDDAQDNHLPDDSQVDLVDSTFRHHDQDEDGALSRHELQKMATQHPHLALDGFRFLDQNGDGLLQEDEVRAAIDEVHRAAEDLIENDTDWE